MSSLRDLMRERVPEWTAEEKAKARELTNLIVEAFSTPENEAAALAFWHTEFMRVHGFNVIHREDYAHACSVCVDAIAGTVTLKENSTENLMKLVAPFVLDTLLHDEIELQRIYDAGLLNEARARLIKMEKALRAPRRRVA